MYHRLMAEMELSWASPEAVGRLTVTQMLCIGNARAPGAPKVAESAADAFAALERIEAEESRWSQE